MDKKILEKLVNQGFSQHKIAEELGCSQTKVGRWLKKHGLKTFCKSGPSRSHNYAEHCLFCSKKLEYEVSRKRTNKKYCNLKCCISHKGTSVNNKHCLFCGSLLKDKTKHNSKYCNLQCHADHRQQKLDADIEANKGSHARNTIKKYIIRKRGHRCEICKRITWNKKKIPLVLDHIDGHHENNEITNLRLVCGNCDMLLPTYKSKNNGNGRAYRRERYKNGLSY